MQIPLDDIADTELWQEIWSNELDGSPLYYKLFLERKPERCARAVAAIANAQPGGVVFHCGRGRDRTGLVTILLLTLMGVSAEKLVKDYEMSIDRVKLLDAALGEPDQGTEIAQMLARKNTTLRDALLDLLASVDVEALLRGGGLQQEDIEALRSRFLSSEDLSAARSPEHP